VAGSPVVVQALATQRVCTGWVMSGHAPSGGAATNFPSALVVTNTATLVWNWKTQYWLDLWPVREPCSWFGSGRRSPARILTAVVRYRP
jgi:hypothetical protein